MKLQHYIAAFAFTLLVPGTAVIADDEVMAFPSAGEYTANTLDQFLTGGSRAGVSCSWTEDIYRSLILHADGSGRLAIRVDVRNERCGTERWEPWSCSNTLHFELQSTGEFETIMSRPGCKSATAGERLRGRWETYSADGQSFLELTYQDGIQWIYTRK